MDYQFSGTKIQEFDQFFSLIDPLNHIYAAGTAANVTFSYDSDTALTSSNNPGFSNFETFSDYDDAGGSVSGSVGADTFSATTTDAIIADTTTPDFSDPLFPIILDGEFLIAGEFLDPTPGQRGTGFTGFDINGFELINLNLFAVGFFDSFATQDLPDMFGSNPSLNNGLQLTFRDLQDPADIHIINFIGSISKVPEPITLALMGIGLVGLELNRRRINC